jgi:hypothetical protein
MNPLLQNIVTHLFHQPSLEHVELEVVQQMARNHPSFAVAQFLLLKKMLDTKHPESTSQLHKTALYFSNPSWLEFLLDSNEESAVIPHSENHPADNPPVAATVEKTDVPEVEQVQINPEETALNQAPPENSPAEEYEKNENNTETAIDSPALASSPLSAELKQLAAEIQAAKENSLTKQESVSETPAFEPYHTIDYFASQGIKLEKIDQNPQDKFGKQLKSFTEWIKTLKRLPQADLQKRLEQNDDSRVIADAAVSLEEKEVVTEAMAEVFEKQGLPERAASVYKKLSLLNPDKSHYFAAKLDALKQ